VSTLAVRCTLLLTVCLSMLLATHTAGAGKVYRWTDENGQIQFSDRAPHNARAQEVKIPSFTGPAEISSEAGVSDGRDVKLYTTASCGYCKRAKAYLNGRHIAFTDLNVETNITAKADFARLNGRGVPVIFVGNQRMDGYSEAGLALLLKNAGY
jgi:glutaredoxin